MGGFWKFWDQILWRLSGVLVLSAVWNTGSDDDDEVGGYGYVANIIPIMITEDLIHYFSYLD